MNIKWYSSITSQTAGFFALFILVTFLACPAAAGYTLKQPQPRFSVKPETPDMPCSSESGLLCYQGSKLNYEGGQMNQPAYTGALWRSMLVPGWGHYYVDSSHWVRGQWHLGLDVLVVTAYLGLRRNAYVLEKNMFTHAAAYSGTDIRDRERAFVLAVGSFESLAAYNDYQRRTRNLDRVFPDLPEFQWQWESDELRMEYRDMRNRRNDLNRQLPVLGVLLIVNRVLSGVDAFSRARSISSESSGVTVLPGPGADGWEIRIRMAF